MKVGQPADKPEKLGSLTGVGSKPTPAETGKSQGASLDGALPTASAQSASEPSAKVALSSTASSLLQDVTAKTAEFDTAKVARISQAITDGKYTIDPEVIADKLIANAKELLSKVAQ
jgi:negative regulator of flagellin synthesis FlgM